MSDAIDSLGEAARTRLRGGPTATGSRIGAADRAVASAVVAALVVAWEIATRTGLLSAVIFPAPSSIVADVAVLWREGYLLKLLSTLGRFAGGVVLGGIPGVFLGLLVGWSPRVRRLADPFVAAIHPIPKIVLFPLFIVIFGLSEWSKLAAIGLTVFFPALINTAAGVRTISPLYFEVVRCYGGGRGALLRHVLLPGSLPMMLSGLRIAANVGLLVTIAIEFTLTTKGIGSVIWLAWQTMRTEDLYVGVVTLSVLGVAINSSLQLLLRRLAPWQGAR